LNAAGRPTTTLNQEEVY